MKPDYDAMVHAFVLECPDILADGGLRYADDPHESAVLRQDWYLSFLGWGLYRRRLTPQHVVNALQAVRAAV